MTEKDGEINYLINNVFLPPKLPGSGDEDVPQNVARLINELVTATGEYVENVDELAQKVMFKKVFEMLETHCYLQGDYGLSSESLVAKLKALRNGGNSSSCDYYSLRY
jgi:hypothetical protein